MARFRFIEDIADATAQAVREMSVCDTTCRRQYTTSAAVIDVELEKNGCNVTAVDENGKNCSNIETAIQNEIYNRHIDEDFDERYNDEDFDDEDADNGYSSDAEFWGERVAL